MLRDVKENENGNENRNHDHQHEESEQIFVKMKAPLTSDNYSWWVQDRQQVKLWGIEVLRWDVHLNR